MHIPPLFLAFHEFDLTTLQIPSFALPCLKAFNKTTTFGDLKRAERDGTDCRVVFS